MFDCQVNVHDSERLFGLPEENDCAMTAEGKNPDLIVSNTYVVRENTGNRLYSTLGQLKPVRDAHPDMQITVGGCLAQKDKDIVVKKAPWVDIVFGAHNLGSPPALLERAIHNDRAEVEIKDTLEKFPSVLPVKHKSTYAGWVSIPVDCNSTYIFCIVPSLRGEERDRRPDEILAEVQAPMEQDVTDITLLGQNVNTCGVGFADPDMERSHSAFSGSLRTCGQIKELGRMRSMPPHPAEFTDDVIDAMVETPNVIHQLHMSLRSDSDRVLKDIRRSYRTKKSLGTLDRVREKMPDAAITTDIIVSFPDETEEDFRAALDVAKKARFSSAFTFQYLPYPGTSVATMPGQIPPKAVKKRYGRLSALQERISEEENAKLVGREVELSVSRSDGRKNTGTHCVSSQSRDGHLAHSSPSKGEPSVVD